MEARLEQKLSGDKRRLEERSESRPRRRACVTTVARGRPLDDDDNRSAICRGVQAGSSQPLYHAGDTSSRDAGVAVPSLLLSPPLPPGPPFAHTHPTPVANLGQDLVDLSGVTEHSASELSELVELAELAELSDALITDQVFAYLSTAAIHDVRNGISGSPVEEQHIRSIPARVKSEMAFEMEAGPSMMAAGQQRVASTLQELFVAHVMCDYTPRSPKKLQMSKWVSCEQLLGQLQSHAAADSQLTPDLLKRLVTEWYKDHPAFIGFSFSEWCKRLKDTDPQAAPRTPRGSQVSKFCFEYTPSEAGR